jgi:hypothetical protein
MNSSSKQIKSPSISPEEEVCKIVGVEYGHVCFFEHIDNNIDIK